MSIDTIRIHFDSNNLKTNVTFLTSSFDFRLTSILISPTKSLQKMRGRKDFPTLDPFQTNTGVRTIIMSARDRPLLDKSLFRGTKYFRYRYPTPSIKTNIGVRATAPVRYHYEREDDSEWDD